MWTLLKTLLKSSRMASICSPLFSLLARSCMVMVCISCDSQELLFPESILYITEELVTIKVAHHMAVYYVLKDLVAYWRQWHWSIFRWVVKVSFLEDQIDVGLLSCCGNLSWSRDAWKIKQMLSTTSSLIVLSLVRSCGLGGGGWCLEVVLTPLSC